MCQCEEVNKTTEVKEKYDAGFWGTRAWEAAEAAPKQFAEAFRSVRTPAKKEACACGLKNKVKELLQTLIHTGTQDARVTDLVMECSALLEAN